MTRVLTMTGRGYGAASMRAAVIGCGAIADVHLRSLRRVRGVEIVAVCDHNAESANRLARKHRVPSVYGDIATMMRDEQLDVLHVTTPPRTHVSVCSDALRNGCHVLVEKPAALSIGELDALLALADAGGVAFSAVHNGLFQRAFRRALHDVQSGAIGMVRSVHITDHIPANYNIVTNSTHWCHALPGGVYGEMLPHDIYLANALVPGLKVDGFRTHSSSRFPWLPIDQICVYLSSESAVVTIHASVDGSDWNKTVEITGTDAALRVDRMCDTVTSLCPTAGWTRRAHIERALAFLGSWTYQSSATATARLARRPVSGHDALIRSFYAALRAGTPPPVSSDALRQTTALFETLTSAITRDVTENERPGGVAL